MVKQLIAKAENEITPLLNHKTENDILNFYVNLLIALISQILLDFI